MISSIHIISNNTKYAVLSKIHIDVMSLIRVSMRVFISAREKLIYSGASWMGVLSQNGALLVRYRKGNPSSSMETELEHKM